MPPQCPAHTRAKRCGCTPRRRVVGVPPEHVHHLGRHAVAVLLRHDVLDHHVSWPRSHRGASVDESGGTAPIAPTAAHSRPLTVVLPCPPILGRYHWPGAVVFGLGTRAASEHENSGWASEAVVEPPFGHLQRGGRGRAGGWTGQAAEERAESAVAGGGWHSWWLVASS